MGDVLPGKVHIQHLMLTAFCKEMQREEGLSEPPGKDTTSVAVDLSADSQPMGAGQTCAWTFSSRSHVPSSVKISWHQFSVSASLAVFNFASLFFFPLAVNLHPLYVLF